MSASSNAFASLDRRRARPALVIDGEAVLVSRKANPRQATTRTEAPLHRIADDPAPRAAFGRRPTQRRPHVPDLVFQGTGREATDRAGTKAAPRGLSVFVSGAGHGKGPRDRRMAGFAAVLALLSLPILLLSAPIAPAEATPGAAAALAQPLVIDQIVTSIVPRGTGAVLSVSGRIRNLSGTPAAVPPLRIALSETNGDVRSKSFAPGIPALAAGRSVRFQSTVAVAKDTRGAIGVGFGAPASSGLAPSIGPLSSLGPMSSLRKTSTE